MTDNEIIGGLRNALERGQSIERAVQSFINAGYNPRTVQEAANELSSGVTQIVNPSTVKENPVQSNQVKSNPVQSNQVKPNPIQFPIYQPIVQPTIQPNSPMAIQPKMDGKQLQGTAKKVVVGLVITFAILIALLLILIVFKEKILLAISS
ncbi:MAG: hypothetical protein Q7S33_00050 [Nanoarchaeota archaeon]|nr:hypothetical protein [Nanoarchaeota archaeon]